MRKINFNRMTVPLVNPFVYNNAVDSKKHFFDREYLIEWILKNTLLSKKQGDVLIIGERKVGKTSLLKYLSKNYNFFISQEKIFISELNKSLTPTFIYISVQDANSETDFYNELIKGLQKTFNNFEIPISENNSIESFESAIEFIFSKGFYIIFLIDEFDALLANLAMDSDRSFFNFLNRLNKCAKDLFIFGKVFSLVLTANQDIGEIRKEFNITRRIPGSGLIVERNTISFFSEKQLKELGNSYLMNYQIKLTAQEISDVYKFTEGYPYFAQKLLHYIFDYKVKNKRDITTKEIKEKIAEIYEQSIQDWDWDGNLQPRTAERLYKILSKLGEKIFDAALTILAKYVEKQMGL